eukprot:5643276-Pleurochrysis_carterae.AAC.1
MSPLAGAPCASTACSSSTSVSATSLTPQPQACRGPPTTRPSPSLGRSTRQLPPRVPQSSTPPPERSLRYPPPTSHSSSSIRPAFYRKQ